jgi:hypothetical protein
MKVIFRLLLVITLLLATTEAFCEEKKSRVKLGSIGETLVDSYQIGIGDILGITTWKEPDFSREPMVKFPFRCSMISRRPVCLR